MPGRHGKRAASPIRLRPRGTAPTLASRISAATSVGVFVMVMLIGVIVEQSVAPRLGVGYRVPRAVHGASPGAAAVLRRTPGVGGGGHAPAVKKQTASLASLPGAVRLAMTTERGAIAVKDFGQAPDAQPIVDLQRHGGSWAFGTAAIGVPEGVAAMPETALFLARASGARWDVTLDGTTAFAQMLGDVPGRLMPAPEEQVLARFNTAQQNAAAVGPESAGATPQPNTTGTQAPGSSGQPGAQPSPGNSGSTLLPSGILPSGSGGPSGSSAPASSGSAGSPASAPAAAPSTAPVQTSLALPWTAGQSWTMISTPGQRPAGADPLAQASFTGGDGRVLAAGSGRVYRFCTSGDGPGPGDALIHVIHPDGSVSEYYQMDHETTVRNGSTVQRGTYLGRTGTSLACGGSSSRPQVEFSLLRAGGRGLDGVAVGGWTFRETLSPLRVWVQRGTTQIPVGTALQNLGSLLGAL